MVCNYLSIIHEMVKSTQGNGFALLTGLCEIINEEDSLLEFVPHVFRQFYSCVQLVRSKEECGFDENLT